MSAVLPINRRRPTDREELVYTVAEVAQQLRLSLGSTYALIRNGTIRAKKLGSRWGSYPRSGSGPGQ